MNSAVTGETIGDVFADPLTSHPPKDHESLNILRFSQLLNNPHSSIECDTQHFSRFGGIHATYSHPHLRDPL